MTGSADETSCSVVISVFAQQFDVCTEVIVTTDCGTPSTSQCPLFPGVDLGSPVAPRCYQTAETHSDARRSILYTHRTVCGVQIHGLYGLSAWFVLRIQTMEKVLNDFMALHHPRVCMVLFDEALQCVQRRCGASLQVSQPNNDFLSLKLPSPPDQTSHLRSPTCQ